MKNSEISENIPKREFLLLLSICIEPKKVKTESTPVTITNIKDVMLEIALSKTSKASHAKNKAIKTPSDPITKYLARIILSYEF